jgi:hypothetical protein
MKVYIFLISIFAALATSCSNASGQTGQVFTENRFNVHAEMMAEQPRQITAKNVAIGNQGVTACFNSCQTQVTLNFCGQVLIEMPGQSPEVYPAKVFQLESGVWTAEIPGGQWVTLYAESGTVQMDIAGEFRAFSAR